MSAIKNRQTGDDIGDAVTRHIMGVQGILIALAPKAHLLMAPQQFEAFALAWADCAELWEQYLLADWRATVAAGEHAEMLARSLGADGGLILPH